MNKQERVIAILLGAALAGWMFYSGRLASKKAQDNASRPEVQAAAVTNAPQAVLSAPPAPVAPAAEAVPLAPPSAPEQVVTLNGGDMTLSVSSHGAVLKRVTLNRFASNPGKVGDDNPPVTLDFADAPALELSGMPGLAPNAAYDVQQDPSGKVVTLTATGSQGVTLTRRIELLPDYQVKVSDVLRNAGDTVVALGSNSVAVGVMLRGASKNELLSVDALPAADKAKVLYGDKDKEIKRLVGGVGGGGFGCAGKAASAVGMPDRTVVPVSGAQKWVAIKSRFFVTGFSSSAANSGFVATFSRALDKPTYVLHQLAVRVLFPGGVLAQGESVTRDYTLYIGPKKLSLLQDLGNGMDAVMEFGTFTWFCKLLVPTLNLFYKLIPNYGVAVILLTFLVRIIFWPLTHKSTVSMRKMQELQPKLKEMQAKFKDNPQKMQQETWALYRENKVNPMSSCLPMVVQIPVFIALFTVLRSAVELRYAPFLWIRDLSEPENLLVGVLPFALNILPILMAATMALQSYLTPSTGDPQQQRMMMVMMPVMMLFMFYGFPSALSLYWTVSQVLSIVQMLMLRRHGAQPPDATGGPADAPLTRQQRRHAAAG